MSATETTRAALEVARQQRDRELAEFQKLQIASKQRERYERRILKLGLLLMSYT
jgi:hypothetical protein